MMSFKRSLHTQMLLQYVAIVLVCMLIIPMSIMWALQMRFRTFAEEKLLEDQKDIASVIGENYVRAGSWDALRASEPRNEFMRWPIVSISVFDERGQLVREFKIRRPSEKRGQDKPEFEEKRPDTPPNFLVHSEDITANGRRVGAIQFRCLPFRDSREGFFLHNFIRSMLWSVGFMLIIAVLIAFFMANRISRPVLMAAKRAYLISRGRYKMDDRVSSDITEIQTLIDSMDKLGLELEEQENLRKRLMSDIAHELRNPVTVVKSHLEAFEDQVWEPTPERIRLTVSEVDRLSLLISEVEKLTTLEKADSLVLSTVNLSDLLEKTALTFDPLYANKSVKLTREIDANVSAVVDTAKIRQVVENLLSNAMRYTDSGGTVKLSLAKEASGIKITVADSGIGISEKDLPYIFERFYRTDKSRARASGGIGIGLAIVKAIVEAHHGSIKAESREGSGSVFTVTLPATLSAE